MSNQAENIRRYQEKKTVVKQEIADRNNASKRRYDLQVELLLSNPSAFDILRSPWVGSHVKFGI